MAPIPRTTTDQLLASVLDEVRGLRADMAAAPQPATETVELREPVTASPASPRPAKPAAKKTATAKKSTAAKRT